MTESTTPLEPIDDDQNDQAAIAKGNRGRADAEIERRSKAMDRRYRRSPPWCAPA